MLGDRSKLAGAGVKVTNTTTLYTVPQKHAKGPYTKIRAGLEGEVRHTWVNDYGIEVCLVRFSTGWVPVKKELLNAIPST